MATEAADIYCEFSVVLNWADVTKNINKYCIIQLVKDKGAFFVWRRWSTFSKHSTEWNGPLSLEEGVVLFNSLFKKKTKGFNYTLIELTDWETSDRMPLGTLSKRQLQKGLDILDDIDAVLNQDMEGDLVALSSQFYSVIPSNTFSIVDSNKKFQQVLDGWYKLILDAIDFN